jgi:hypothetical protein
MIRDSNNVTINKAYFNYQLIAYDGSKGMHNTLFAVDVLQKSINALGGGPLDVESPAELPVEFSLLQNYPNPFNPSTTVKYTIPFESSIKITMYSLTGELISTLVNEVKQTGTYEVKVNMNGKNLASGIYFYSIEAKPLNGKPAFRETRKMVLMK